MEYYIKELNDILAKTGWAQTELSAKLGVTFATVNRWLNCRTSPHPGHLRLIHQLHKNIIGILPLPDKIINVFIKRVKQKKKRFKNIYKTLQNRDITDEFILQLTYHSDAIEGSTLSIRETESIIFDKAAIKDKGLIEHLEAANHAVLISDIFRKKHKSPVNEAAIKCLHSKLLQGIREDAGEYAVHERGIRGVSLALPHPDDIDEEMSFFCKKINTPGKDPLFHIPRMHADFESIHPFGDGNGRIGRLIMIIQFIEAGYAPPLITAGSKAEYYEYLEYAQKKSSTHLVKFVLEAVLKGYDIIEKYV